MEPAARLYRCFSRAVIDVVSALEDVETWVFFTPADAAGECRELLPQGRQAVVQWQPQSEGDLGTRMAGALRQLLDGAQSGARAVLIGTDVPSVDRATLRQAFDSLCCVDVVVGPAVDGGYYLVGMNQLYEQLFCDVAWSTGEVLPETVRRCRRLGLTLDLVGEKQDVDTLDDLRALWRELESDRKRGAAFSASVWEACRDVLGGLSGPQ